jgi:pyrroloquinoline-quinone synthase
LKPDAFFRQLHSRIAPYDLLCHPFYKAWSAGELTADDLRDYAEDYYHHVAAFPTYLAEFAARLEPGELRQAVLDNRADEEGLAHASPDRPVAHSELWLDFVEGMGGERNRNSSACLPAVAELVEKFRQVAREGTEEEALASFYAYESQVPRIASEKAQGLRTRYGADEKTCAYFTLHATADVYHAEVWRKQLGTRVESDDRAAERALAAAESAAKQLWWALDGIEQRRRPAPAALVR